MLDKQRQYNYFHNIVTDFLRSNFVEGRRGGHVFDPVLTSCFIQLAFTGHKDTGNGAGTYIVVILLIYQWS